MFRLFLPFCGWVVLRILLGRMLLHFRCGWLVLLLFLGWRMLRLLLFRLVFGSAPLYLGGYRTYIWDRVSCRLV